MAIYFHDILYLNEEKETSNNKDVLNSFFKMYKDNIVNNIKNSKDNKVILTDILKDKTLNTVNNSENNSFDNSKSDISKHVENIEQKTREFNTKNN
jgi:hypothetical protein